jgi:hypothetical protein
MAGNKSSISKKSSYREIGDYWDSHDLGKLEEKTKDVSFSVEFDSDVHYFALEDSLSSKLRLVAKKRGVSLETLLNLWLQEKVIGEVSNKR